MPEESPAFRALVITAVKNGFAVYPRDRAYRDGYDGDMYVFATVEQMCDWMREQVWAFSPPEV